ncbi:hypothetical protein CAPTEDRAFT_185097 [Capitella teleta]|uniref:WSC domain-containing protein n=1 Tax=Capitella teleta TaxID=283909 RepID=R7V5N7_CAPTE|nr:hypothetical protein CAPTEDRAFT_185097 [Capitella teleta]|eukprot:ELU13777.1 hypothetical protein CAPTEDRAFT_185097 [Capitella teleta]
MMGRGYTKMRPILLVVRLHAGTECFCGNNYDYDRHGLTPDDCTRECRNYASETCGGDWRSQTYSVCPTGKYKGEGDPVINDEPNCENECHCTELPCFYINGTCTDGCAIGWRAHNCNERDCEVENGGCQHQCTEDERDEWCSCDDGFEIPDEDWRNCTALNNTHFGENHTFASKKLRKSQFSLSYQYDRHNTHCDYRGYVV